MRKVLLLCAVTLALGLAIGFFLGRALLEREWRDPLVTISDESARRSAANDADATPRGGAKVLRPMPLRRARLAVRELTKDDPLVLRVGAVGNGEDGAELHLVLHNRGKCKIAAFEGVVYGFDAFGVPARLNRGGEPYLAVSSTAANIDPDATYVYAARARYPETASLAIAHVDSVTCDDGKRWTR